MALTIDGRGSKAVKNRVFIANCRDYGRKFPESMVPRCITKVLKLFSCPSSYHGISLYSTRKTVLTDNEVRKPLSFN